MGANNAGVSRTHAPEHKLYFTQQNPRVCGGACHVSASGISTEFASREGPWHDGPSIHEGEDVSPTFGNGKICYVEIPAESVDISAAFYERVFDWTIRTRADGSVSFDDGV